MKYTILDVAPGQIKVEYEDKTWAVVPIAPGATLEDIDNEVSKFDPDFLKKQEEVCNPDVYIGQERVSVRKENEEPIAVKLDPVNVPDTTLKTKIIPGTIYNRPFSLDSIAKYFLRKGDSRLQDVLDSFIEGYLNRSNVSVEELIAEANELNPIKLIQGHTLSDDDLMAQAEAELEAEKIN